MNYNNLCYRCFFEKPIIDKPCPRCGYEHTPTITTGKCLLPGTLLNNRYVVGIALGVGGFGITYKCLDTKIGGICAIKEYFPANFAVRNNATKLVSVMEQNLERYNKIMKRFVEEAELVKTFNHRNVIKIYDNFFENNTAYYVMEYCDGIDLRRYTNDFKRKLGYEEGLNILFQVMNGLEYIHNKGILHRDIAPDNIYITKNNSVKILDFGSARSEMDQFNRELSVIVKVGYAPIEQYGGHGKQGPYTDIYALGATFYHLFTSRIPMESTQRVSEDTLEEFSRLRPDLPDNLKYCIEKAMELPVSRRISNIAEMKRILGLDNNSLRPSPPRRVNRRPQTPPKPPVRVITPPKPPAGAVTPPKPPVRVVTPPKPSAGARQTVARSIIPGFGRRMAAYAIDASIWITIFLAVFFGLFGVEGGIGMFCLFPTVFALINTIMELTASTTIGKAMLRMYVRGQSSIEVMPGQVLLRNLIKALGIFVLIFSKDNALLQDRLTDSIIYIKD